MADPRIGNEELLIYIAATNTAVTFANSACTLARHFYLSNSLGPVAKQRAASALAAARAMRDQAVLAQGGALEVQRALPPRGVSGQGVYPEHTMVLYFVNFEKTAWTLSNAAASAADLAWRTNMSATYKARAKASLTKIQETRTKILMALNAGRNTDTAAAYEYNHPRL